TVRLPGKGRARMIALIAAAALMTAGGRWLLRRVTLFTGRIGPLIVAELRASVGRDLEIASVDYRIPGILRLRGVRLAGRERHGASLAARQLVIRYRWRDLLFGERDPGRAVESVEADGLRLRVARSADGRWNGVDLLPSAKRRPALHFRGRVVV